MRQLHIIRMPQIFETVAGVLLIEGCPRFVTLEDAWLDNRPNLSCIPAGRYEIQRHQSPKFGETFIIKDVPGRSYILFHWGNNIEDTRGCILVGSMYGVHRGRPCVWRSREAFEQFMETMRGVEEAILHIQSCAT